MCHFGKSMNIVAKYHEKLTVAMWRSNCTWVRSCREARFSLVSTAYFREMKSSKALSTPIASHPNEPIKSRKNPWETFAAVCS